MQTTPEHEADLVTACLAHDRRAQETFYRRYAPAALTVCRRYARGREDALSLLNIGMMKVFDKLGTFRGEGSLEGWIKRVVFHATIDEVRRDRRERPTLEIADWDSPEAADAPRKLYADDLCRLIDRLPEASREVFWLFAVEGYTHAEIALKLNFSEGNSRWHLSRARQQLRKQLNHHTLQAHRHAG